MSQVHAVYENGLFNGWTIREWLPEAIEDLVQVSQPVKVILFGSVARGDEGPDSDLDFLVILDHLDPAERRRLRGKFRMAVRAPVAMDIFVTDVEECERRRDVIGSMHYWPLREGKVVYERPS